MPGRFAYPPASASGAHDHTTADGSGVLTADEHDSHSEYAQVAAPAAPASGKVRLYASSARAGLALRNAFLDGILPRALSVQRSASDSIDAGSGTTETAFATAFAIPANLLLANKALIVLAAFALDSTASPPSLTLRARLQKAGPVNVTLYVPAFPQTPAPSLSNRGWSMGWLLQAAAAPGAAVAVEAVQLLFGMGHGPQSAQADYANSVAQPVTVDTAAQQTFQLTAQWGTATAGNLIALRQLLVLEVN
jgi:hypothetical protein